MAMSDEKPQNGQIKVSCDSGANIHSRHDQFLEVQDLGFDSRKDWDAATPEQKHTAVQEHFAADGFPEFSWED